MSLDDYFTKGSYEGEIYKTVNMRNLAISQYCKDSLEVKKEQKKIEQQLKDFRTNLWNAKTVAEIRQDSINAAIEAANDTVQAKDKKEKKATRRKSGSKEKKSVKKTEQKNDGGSMKKAARVSVRRARR